MQEEKSLVWLDTREGMDGEMELVVRLPGWDERQGALCAQICVRGEEESGYLLNVECHMCLVPSFRGDGTEPEAVVHCPGVKLWNPERPRLYEVIVEIRRGEREACFWRQRIGFRNLERRGRQVFWNGRPVKLKGVCYREKAQDPEGMKQDLELFARANVNFIRGIYGPFSETFLELCDEMGFWVENTAPFYGVGDTNPATQDLPHLKENYLEAFRRMAAVGSHTSVLIWSLGHDCVWGANFRLGAEYLRGVDPIRLLTFHLPMSIPEEEEQMDVWPVHYTDFRQPFDVCYDQMVIFHTPGAENEIGYLTGQADYEMPVLHEVWSPVACHNRDEIQRDPSIRRFWGESIRRFADKSWRTPGCLGGAVLAGVDEDGSFEGMESYTWGILDKAHCPKPEYEELRSAYAPLAVRKVRREREQLVLEAESRLLFTDLPSCCLVVDGVKQKERLPERASGSVVEIRVDREASSPSCLQLSLVAAEGGWEYGSFVCDTAKLWERASDQGRMPETAWTESNRKESVKDPLVILEAEEQLLVKNSCFTYVFDKRTCLMEKAYGEKRLILAGGPYLNCTGLRLGPWQGTGLTATPAEGKVQVTIDGCYKNVLSVRFILIIGQDGMLETCYEVQKLFRHMPHTVKAGIGVSPGGLHEKGIAYLLPPEAEVEAEAGDGSLSAVESGRGSVGRQNGWQPGENPGTTACIQVCAPFGNVRIEDAPEYTEDAVVDDRDRRMRFEGKWYRMDDDCGNYRGTETLSKTPGDTMRLEFTGTGVKVYGPLDVNYGMCDIYLDGNLVKERADQYPDRADLEGASRGYEKRYGRLLASVRGLPETGHTLEVRVCGSGATGTQNPYTSIDYAVLEGSSYPVGKWLYVNREFNYTRLVRGCYKNPRVELVTGVRESVRMRLAARGAGSRDDACGMENREHKEGEPE